MIHPFEVHETKWKLITPIKVSFDDGSLGVEVYQNSPQPQMGTDVTMFYRMLES